MDDPAPMSLAMHLSLIWWTRRRLRGMNGRRVHLRVRDRAHTNYRPRRASTSTVFSRAATWVRYASAHGTRHGTEDDRSSSLVNLSTHARKQARTEHATGPPRSSGLHEQLYDHEGPSEHLQCLLGRVASCDASWKRTPAAATYSPIHLFIRNAHEQAIPAPK